MSISPAQCRAARGLLNLTQVQLAHLSRVSLRTIVSFEKGTRVPIPANASAIQSALEGAGVNFVEGGALLATEA